jgi:hypothetical protein
VSSTRSRPDDRSFGKNADSQRFFPQTDCHPVMSLLRRDEEASDYRTFIQDYRRT